MVEVSHATEDVQGNELVIGARKSGELQVLEAASWEMPSSPSTSRLSALPGLKDAISLSPPKLVIHEAKLLRLCHG